MKKKIEEKPIAVLTLYNANEWSQNIRAQVVHWLENHAADLLLYENGYTKIFRAKFFQ